jgi:hypothetical protein
MNNLNRFHTATVLRAIAFFGLFSLIGIAATTVQDPLKQPQNLMYGVNMPGLDYKWFNMRADISVPEHRCAQSCREDPNCHTWTLVKPPYQGPLYVCYHKSAIPQAFVNACCISGVPFKEIEMNTNRPGNDYRRIDFSVIAPPPGVRPSEFCKNGCRNDPNCKAWTYVHPGIQGPKGVCYLKGGSVPNAHTSDCCISGVVRP